MNPAALGCVTFAIVLVGMVHLQSQALLPAVPLEPVRTILDVLRSTRVVGLGLGTHNNEQGHAFLLSLIRHADFPSIGADLVVECGNARYQDAMDRFVAGEDVPTELLRRIWQDTTQPHAGCDVPLHEELYRSVRSVNASTPPGLRVRVLLGDPPIDWDTAPTRQDRARFMAMRASHPAEVIQHEVLKKGRRAVVVYGQMHLQRQQLASNYDMAHPLAQTIVSLLEGVGTQVFTIWGNTRADLETLEPGVTSWSRPSLALVRGTPLGAADFEFFFGLPLSRVAVIDGKLTPVPRNQWRSLRMEDQFDALLYLGPPSSITIAELPAALCADAPYMHMRLARLDAEGPKTEADRLRQYCAGVLK